MKKRLHRGLCLVLALLMLVTAFGTTVTALGNENEGQAAPASRLYRGTFSFADRNESFYYSDAFFFSPGSETDEHLRTMSAAVAFSLAGTDTQSTLDLMTDIGMDMSCVAIDDMGKGTVDSIGSVIAHKMINGTPLVAVAIRGDAYDCEWASNVLAGSAGDASGISSAAAKVSTRLQSYLDEFDLENAKIWVSGYSRAGGVANLIGRYMNEDPSAYHTSADDIYVYTFEAPRVSSDDTVYANIHNIEDVNDVIPRLYPEVWGLHLNGVTETIGDPSDTVMTRYLNVTSDDRMQDYKEKTKTEFLTQFERFVGEGATREYYATNSEQYLSEVLSIYFGKSQQERKAMQPFFEKVGDLIMERNDLGLILFGIVWEPTSQSNVDKISAIVIEAMDEARASTNPPITDEEYARVKTAVPPLVALGLQLCDIDASYSELNDKGKEKRLRFYHYITFCTNLNEFIDPHYSYNVWDQLTALDSYYTEEAPVTPGNVYADERYTYSQYGEALYDKALELGFIEDDLTWLKNGYDIRFTTVAEQIADPDIELILKAMGTLDKSMNFHAAYRVMVTKTLGYRTRVMDSSTDQAAYPVNLSIPKEIGTKYSRFRIVRIGNDGAAPMKTVVGLTETGDTRLSTYGKVPAIFVAAYGTKRMMMLADVDKDEVITSIDVTHIRRYLAQSEDFDEYQLRVGDVDGDGDVTVLDATWIQRRLAVMSTPYEIGGLLEW